MNKTLKSYRMSEEFGRWTHRWAIEGEHMAVEFWTRDINADVDPVCGLEAHYRRCPPHRDPCPPDHPMCSVLRFAPCWHDGTSLYARERYMPHFSSKRPDHDTIFMLLADDLERYQRDLQR